MDEWLCEGQQFLQKEKTKDMKDSTPVLRNQSYKVIKKNERKLSMRHICDSLQYDQQNILHFKKALI